MHITILTLFPDMFKGPLDASIVKRAREKKLIDIQLLNIRDFSTDRYKSVDDHPYGGGAGMLLRVDILDRAIESSKCKIPNAKCKTILLDPQGKKYDQKKAVALSSLDHLVLICGHYEGVDERVRRLVDEEISVGDYVTTGGELPAMIMIDSITRLLPGVLTKSEATKRESFSENLLEYPQYTRPETYKGMKVPPILLSGDHAKIEEWRKKQAKAKTRSRRPDLLTRTLQG